jgi:hypothetical protein
VRFVVAPESGAWRWTLVDDLGEVHAQGTRVEQPGQARADADRFRKGVYLAPIEMGT